MQLIAYQSLGHVCPRRIRVATVTAASHGNSVIVEVSDNGPASRPTGSNPTTHPHPGNKPKPIRT